MVEDDGRTTRRDAVQQALRALDGAPLHDDLARGRSRDALAVIAEALRSGTAVRCATRSSLLGTLGHLRLQVSASRDVDRLQIDLGRLLQAVRRHLDVVSA